jgi:hypothetical protein
MLSRVRLTPIRKFFSPPPEFFVAKKMKSPYSIQAREGGSFPVPLGEEFSSDIVEPEFFDPFEIRSNLGRPLEDFSIGSIANLRG